MHLPTKTHTAKDKMKKILLFLTGVLMLTFASCVPDDNDQMQFHFEYLPVETVTLPETVQRGQTYPITVTFNRPTDCYYFDSFYYDINGYTRTVAVQAIVIENASCDPLTNVAPEQKSFNFYCSPGYANNEYTFKFYKGVDTQGNDVFEEHTVTVEQ